MTGKQNRLLLQVIAVLCVLALIITFSNRIYKYDTPFHYGLDIKGGVRVVLRAKTEEFKGSTGKWNPDTNLESVRKVIERRVNATGVSEPQIIVKKPDQIIVELPGLKDEEKAVKSLGSTASLEFYLLPQLGDKDGLRPSTWAQKHVKDPKTGDEVDVLVDKNTDREITPEQLQDQVFGNKDLLIASGIDLLDNSHAVPDPTTNNPIIEFQFNEKGSKDFEEATRANVGRFLAIFLDKKLLTAPTINSVIPGKGIIQGNFTLETAKALSDQLNAGALPVPLEIVETRKLEATLGAEAVRTTFIAGMVGLGLVLLIMIWWYRLPGVLADIALVLYTLFSLSLFKLVPITLTLPGIAGFILSIGMAVDANILIFERFKEELRSGKSLRVAIDTGFKRAFTAIFDSNVCTIGTCLILYNFGTGPIRGFALTLGLGVAVSMFTAITVTRTFLFALVGFPAAQNPNVYGVTGDQKVRSWNVMRRKMLWLGISIAIIVPGMIAWLGGGIKQSIDFKGGTEIQIPFADRHSSSDILRVLGTLGDKFKDSRAVVSEDPNQATKHLATVVTESLTTEERTKVLSALKAQVGPLDAGKTDLDVGYSNVSGTISKELTKNAFTAVLLASALIVLYLAVRFAIGGFADGLKYGVCAVIALLHDVLVLWGVFALMGKLFGWQIDSLFVTAMLTVIGFSVHDTIIVFDRIRENLQHRNKGESYSDLADRSIDQTIVRSIRTSFTVVLVLLALFFFGGTVIHEFSFALLIGIISGTYSSIFNATVLLVMFKQNELAPAAASGNAARSAALPRAPLAGAGERSIITPRPRPETTLRTAPSVIDVDAMETGDSGTSDAPRNPRTPAPSRRQPTRRRRM